MIRTSGRVAALWAIVAGAILATALPAFSQAPTDAQRSAIRSACRSDYIAHCSSVPPGGMASLQCLQKNMSSLSSSCKAAVDAIGAPAEPKAEAKPESKPETKSESKPEAKPEAAPAEKPAAETAPASTPKAAATTATKKPSSAQATAIRSACRSDYMAHCASVPTGGAAALNCLKQNKSKLSANCQQAVNAAGGGAASGAAVAPAEGGAPPAGGAPTDTAAAAPGAAAAVAPMVLRPMRPREVLFVLRSACGGDVRALCADVPPGGGRIVQCLAAQAASLSTDCHNVLGSFAQ
jgi:hypothetical protein